MDTFCTGCGEPWDTYHMRHDEIHETDLPDHVKESFTGTSDNLTEEVRKAFRANRWEFGHNVLVIKRCPGCPKHLTVEQKALARQNLLKVETIESVMGDDLDGLASSIEDMIRRDS